MTQFILDDQLSPAKVHDPIARWSVARFVRDVRPGEIIKDERIPVVLRTVQTPTFITIDDGFWTRRYRDRRYCILFFRLRSDEEGDIPLLLRRLLRLPEFRTRAARMGKVARVSRDHITWWQAGDEESHTLRWNTPARRRAGG